MTDQQWTHLMIQFTLIENRLEKLQDDINKLKSPTSIYNVAAPAYGPVYEPIPYWQQPGYVAPITCENVWSVTASSILVNGKFENSTTNK